jgi:hypothetical protein
MALIFMANTIHEETTNLISWRRTFLERLIVSYVVFCLYETQRSDMHKGSSSGTYSEPLERSKLVHILIV